MTRALIIVILMLPAASFAAEKVWNCQEVASSGLIWKDGKYTDTLFKLDRYTIRQKDDKLIFPKELDMDGARCKRRVEGIIDCKHVAHQFIINTNTGRASYSRGFGWVYSDVREDLIVSALTCETS